MTHPVPPVKHGLSLLLFCLAFLSHSGLSAQEKDSCKISFDVSAEFVSSYIWRGLEGDLSPNIQPSVALNWGNFQAGIWGSSNLHGSYREVDPWISYTYKGFTLALNDYFYTPNDTLRFFNYEYDRTGHLIEAQLSWEGPETFPVRLTAASFVMGPDNKFDHYDTLTQVYYYNNQYSTYFEAAYAFSIKDTEMEAFTGGTFMEGYYGHSAGIINLGVKATRDLRITDRFNLPASGSFILNPQTGRAYLVLGISI